MERGWWNAVGEANMTEYWRSVVPALSVDPDDDQTGLANDQRRAARVRQRYALELKHLARTEGGRSWVASDLTRIADWSPLTEEERQLGRPHSPFVLCRGVPSGLLATASIGGVGDLDFAILVSVPPEFLPAGPLILDGVALVIRGHRPIRPLPGNADALWPPEPAIPSYLP
jgi:hypothetical protein